MLKLHGWALKRTPLVTLLGYYSNRYFGWNSHASSAPIALSKYSLHQPSNPVTEETLHVACQATEAMLKDDQRRVPTSFTERIERPKIHFNLNEFRRTVYRKKMRLSYPLVLIGQPVVQSQTLSSLALLPLIGSLLTTSSLLIGPLSFGTAFMTLSQLPVASA